MKERNAIRLHAKADNLWARACTIFPKLSVMPQPETRVNARLKTTAGRSCSAQNWIDFNAYLLENETETILTETLPHEMAHNIADRLYGSTGHDDAWRKVFYALTGREATRLHSMDISAMRATRKIYAYVCECREWQFTGQRNALYHKGHGYRCPQCEKNIHPKA